MKAKKACHICECADKIGETMIVRCNWCLKQFEESKIIVKEEVEHCPNCGKKGYLMDIKGERE